MCLPYNQRKKKKVELVILTYLVNRISPITSHVPDLCIHPPREVDSDNEVIVPISPDRFRAVIETRRQRDRNPTRRLVSTETSYF